MRKYIGAGDHLPGMPARSLSDAEWEALPEDLRARAEGLGLYRHVKDRAPATGPKRAAPAGGA